MRRAPLVAVIVSFACLPACRADPELVAVKRDRDPFPTPTTKADGCIEGFYSGFFQTGDPPDGGATLKLSGSLSFTLVQEGNEFPHLAPDAKLEGTSDDEQSQLSANVVSQDCKAGAIASTLTDGEFTILKTGTQEAAFPSAHFEGTVAGTYDPDVPGFIGTWQTTVNDTDFLRLRGTWVAFLTDQ
jgi:hypothetical protein